MIDSKKKQLEEVIKYCSRRRYGHIAAELENARSDMFTAIEKRPKGKRSSKVERIIVNMRANVSKWSEAGVLNVTKIRLAY